MTLALRPRPAGATLLRWLCDEIRLAIVEGRVLPGTKLPSTRSIALQYGIARGTAVAAFEHLIEEGYIVGTAGSGSFVREDSAAQASLPPPGVRGPSGATVFAAPSLRVREPRRLSNPALLQWLRLPRHGVLHGQAKYPTSGLKLGPIGQICRSVRDIRESERWYRETLGLEHLYTSGSLAFFDCGGMRLLLMQAQEPLATESPLYFRVAHVGQAHEELKLRGVEFIQAPHLIRPSFDGPEEWMAIFSDPDGRPLAIMSQVTRVS